MTDIQYGMRILRRSPVFTLIAILVLSTGIGMASAIFSIIDGTLLNPLPYPEAGRLVIFGWQARNGGFSPFISAQAFVTLQQGSTSLESAAATEQTFGGANLSGSDQPQYVHTLNVSKDFFRTMRFSPALGREFTADEGRPGVSQAVVLSYSLWQNDFHGDQGAIGKTVHLNGQPSMITGVMPKTFLFYPAVDLYCSLQFNGANSLGEDGYQIIGRLKPGVSIQRANEEFERLGEDFRKIYTPKIRAGDFKLYAQSYHEFIVGQSRGSLSLLFGAVALIFLISCTNVATLLLARSTMRQHEIAIRTAFGAGRIRLIRMLFIETFLLSCISGALGLLLAEIVLPILLFFSSENLPRPTEIGLNFTVVLFTAVLSLITSFLFGLIPVVRTSQFNVQATLRAIPRTSGINKHQARMGWLLIMGQTVLAVILLCGASLLVESVRNLEGVSPGFDADSVYVGQVSLTDNAYQSTAQTTQFVNAVLEKLQRAPGILNAAETVGIPLERIPNIPMFPAEEREKALGGGEYQIVTPTYFATLTVSLKTGREFAANDTADNAPVAIINETLARKWWPGTNPVGRYVILGEGMDSDMSDKPREIIGVVSDMRTMRLDHEPPPTVFVPQAQVPNGITSFLNKVFVNSFIFRASSHANTTNIIQAAVQSTAPDMPIASFRPLTDVLGRATAQPRFYAWLVSLFASFAALMTGVGLHGLLTYHVNQRRYEIGVRLALGAQKLQVVLLILRQALLVTAIGICVGVAGAFGLGRFMKGMVYGISPTDPFTLLGVVLALTIVAGIAVILPIRRTIAVNPIMSLKAE